MHVALRHDRLESLGTQVQTAKKLAPPPGCPMLFSQLPRYDGGPDIRLTDRAAAEKTPEHLLLTSCQTAKHASKVF